MGKLIEAIQSLFKPKNESSSSKPSSANSGSSGGSSSGKSIAGFSFTPLGTSESGERPSPWAEVKKTTSTPKSTGNIAPFFGGTSTAKSVSSFVPTALPKDNGGSVQTEQKKSFLGYLKPVVQTGNAQPSVQTDGSHTKKPLISTPNYSWDQYKSDLNAIRQKTDNGIFRAKKEITQPEAQERATKTYNDRTRYYGSLMNNIDLGTDKGKADYKDLITRLDTEIESKARPKLGEDDGFAEFDAKALRWVKDDLVNRARELELEQNRVSAQQYNDNIDSMIVATGVTSAPDYEVMSAKGMEAIEQKLASQRKRAEAMDEMYNRLVDPEGKTSGRVDLFASDWDDYDALSYEQKRLFGYIYATQGEDAAEDVFINFLGDVARYNQGVESTENMLSSDNAINRGFRKVLSGLPSAIATALSGWEQTIKNSSVEDNDKSQLFAGVSVDDMKRNIVANLGVDLYDEGVQRAAVNAWQNGGSTGEWYQELMTNGSDEEKVLYNYLLAAYGEETAAQTYSVVQDDVDYITRTMQGSGALPIGSEQVRNQLLDDYYGMSGADSIFFDDMTRGQALNLMIDTASQQLFQKGIQLGISAIPGVGAFAKPISLALLGAQVYGNTYNAAKREGYSDRESAIYASAMGATEVAAELLLDGFTGYDGVLMKKINASTWVENIANPLMKGLVKAGFNAAGEGFEEVFSDVVEPIARGLILKDESASFDFSQAKDDFVAAAVTTLLMGAGGDISQEYGYSGYGESLSKMNATRKIIDTIQLVPVGQSKNQVKSYQEAQKIADGIMSGRLKATDNNVGRMTSAYIHAGGDLEFLANPMTACYTVDNVSVDDMAAAATSRLVDLGGDTKNPVTAMAIAKTAKGASLTTEEKAAFDAEKSASQIVEELSGDANSLEDNALTRAARASISGQTVQQKTYETLKQSNPQAHVADPATQYLLEQGVDQRQALAQGAIIAAVKDGVQVDAKTAGKIKLNSIPTRYVLMDQLGIEADATTTQAELMQMLNDKAAEFAALKVEQQELKAATKAQIKNETKQATREAKRARLTAQMAAENGGANGEQVRQLEGNDVRGTVRVPGQAVENLGEGTPESDEERPGYYVGAVGQGGQRLGESKPRGSGRGGPELEGMGGGERPAVIRGPGGLTLNYEDPDASHTVDVADLLAGKSTIIGADGKPMQPAEQKKLGERCVATKRRLNKNGFYSVRFFFNTMDDYKAYGGRITKTDTGFNVDICLNSKKFTLEQYARHETMHLWLRAFQYTKRSGDKKDLQIVHRFTDFAKTVWGEKFDAAYKKQLEKYQNTYPGRPIELNQREALGELLCIAYGAQEIPGRDGSDPGVQERLQKWMKDNHVEAMGSGDMSDPYVREAVKDGNYEHEFYRVQGFLTEENSADNLFGLARFTGPEEAEETQEKPKKPRGRSNKVKNVETPIGIAFQSKEASERSQMVKNARDKLKGMSVDEREFLEDRYAQYKDVIDSLRVGDKFIQTEDDKSIMIGEVIAQDSRYVLISNSAGTEDSDLTLILKDHKKQNGAFISLTGETYFDDDVVIQYSSDEAYDNYEDYEDYEELMSDSLEREGVRENEAAYEYGMFKEDSEATDKGMIGEEEETSAKLDKSLEEVDFSKMTPDEVTEYWNNFAVAQESMMDKTLEEDLTKEDEKQAKAEAKKRAKAEEKQKAKKAESPVAQAFKPKAESVNAEETVDEKPKRGRPKGSKNKPKVTETAPAVETKAAETATASEAKATETAPAVETKAAETANPAAVFQEAPGQKTAPAMNDYWIRRTVTALTKDGKDGGVYSMNGETFIESGDGHMAVPVRVADVDRFKAATTLGEVTEPPVVTQGDNFTKLANAPRVAVTADGRYYEFATEAGPVYFESKRFNYFDGAALEIGTMADGGHVLKATNQDGTIRGYLSSFDVDPASVTEYKNAYGMKSFAEPKPKTEAKEPKTEAKKPKSEAQKPKKTEQKPKTEAKKPKAEAKKPAPEKTERDKAVAVAFAPKAKATEAKTTEAKAAETKAPTNATGLTFNNKVGNWVNNLANADNIGVARPNANRNTYQVVAFTKGKAYVYDDVSPSMLKKAFGKDKAAEIVSTATEKAGEIASFDIEHAPVVDQKAAAAERAKKRAEEKAARERDTYGCLVSKGMMSFMQNSKARTDDSTDGALVPVYRVAEPGAVHNAKLIGGVSIWTDKPAVANTWRGMKGAEAYGQTGKRIGPKGHRTTIDAAMTQLAELDPKSKEAAQYRALIAASERKLREYTNGVTRLDPWREAFSTPHDEDIVNGAALYECYLNLTNPLVVDAKGKGPAYVQEIAGKIQDSEYDGAIIHNVNGIVTDTNLGGGELDLSTVYITTKAGQAKSTLNTNPTDDALMQYSDDEFIDYDELNEITSAAEELSNKYNAALRQAEELESSENGKDMADDMKFAAEIYRIVGDTLFSVRSLNSPINVVDTINRAIREIENLWGQHQSGSSIPLSWFMDNIVPHYSYAKGELYKVKEKQILSIITSSRKKANTPGTAEWQEASNARSESHRVAEGNGNYTEKGIDTNGSKLSPGQMDYFKDSLSVDKNGNLVKGVTEVFHGTASFGFDKFDPEHSADRIALFFTSNEATALSYTGSDSKVEHIDKAYTPGGKKPAAYSVYLKMENPLIIEDQGGGDWFDLKVPDDVKRYAMQLYRDNDAEGLSSTDGVAKYAYAKGYDGVIIKNILDVGVLDAEGLESDVYIVFDSNQVKDTTNTEPTDDPRIQFSDDEFITAEIEAGEKADRADEIRERLLDDDDLYRLRGDYYRFMSSDEENLDVDLEDIYEALYFDKQLREDVSYLLHGNKAYSDDMLYGEFKREISNPFIDFLRHEYYSGQQETAKITYKTGSLADRPGFRSKLLEAVEKLQTDKNGRIKVNAGTINRINNAGGGVPAAEMNMAMVKQFLEGRDSFTVDEFRQWYNEHNANLDILELTGDEARWKEYQMKSLGESYDYTERLYVLPRFMGYRNDAMNTHWGKVLMHDADAICDVAVHARYNHRPDPQTGEMRLFIEEIQSDWDNARGKNHSGPSAPLDSSKYPEFVLKQLIKEAVDNAEGVAWTDAHTQATRWSYQFFTAYRNLYDRALVKAASKYGKVYHEDVSGPKGLTDDTWKYYDYLVGEFPENYDGNQIYQAAYDMSMAVRLANGSSPEDKIGVAVDSFVTRAQPLPAGHNYNLSKHLADNPEVLRNLYTLIQEVDGKEGYWVLELDEKGYNQFKNGEVYAYSDDEFVEYDFSDDESAENNYADGTLESNILNVLHKAGNSEEASAALAEYVSNLLNTGEIPLVDAKTAAQERAANVFQPKVSREEHDVIRDQLDDLIEKYGAIPKGYKPQRDVAIPKSTDGETFVRNFVRTAVEAKGVTDASVELLERGVLQDQMLSHSVQTDKAAIANADRTIRKLGFQRALNEWRGRADGERAMTKNDVVLGECLMIAANKAGDLETGYQLAAELAEAGTNAGQVTQAFSILKKAPPAWQLYYINRVVNRMNTKYAKRINSGKMTQVVINRDLAKAVLRAKTQEDITTAMDALLDDIATQIPATYMDKWNAWRYLAMLGNPRTHIRNIVGNAIFTPAKFAKDMIAAGLESGFENAGFEFTRSKTTRPVSAERKAFAEADFEGIRDELQSGGKYNPENVIEQHRTIFGIPLLEMARKKNGDYLEAEDAIFLKRHYVNALGKYLEANNADLNWLRTTKDGARLLNAARQYAVLEARKATYRDASRVASALNSLKNVPGLGVLMEGAMPFTKTPVNILKRGIEYSPVGLIKTIATETGKLKTGEINVNTYCDNLAAGMTGTGIMFLGAFLTSLGLLRGGPDDDDKKAEFDKLQGYQDYSITIGDQNFTIDWACPVAMPLFVGAELYKAFDKGDGLSNGDWMNLATVIAEPMTQLSMLSGLNDALSSAKYDKNPLSSVAVTLGTGYISQVFPTLLAQISRSMVEDRRTTYVDKNSDVPAALQRWFQSNVMGKTPANASRAKYIDAWGRYDTDASLLVRLFDNMIAPWYRNTITTEPLEAELTRLSESVGTGVLMTTPDRYVDWNNNRIDLTAEQYSDLALTRGQTLHIALDSLINSEAYSAMTDEQRAKAVENIKNYATYAGRKEVIPEYHADIYNWIDKCDGDPNRIENMAIMRSVANSLGVDADNNSKFYDLVIGADWMTPQEQGQILSQTYVTTSKTFKYGGKTYDLTPEVKAALYQEYRNVFPLYYAELAATEKWQTATGDKKLGLLADLRRDVAANCRKVIGAQLSNGTLGTLGTLGSTGVFSSTDTLGNSSNLTGAGTLGQFPW